MFFSRSASRKRFRRELFRFPYEDEKKKKMTTFFLRPEKKCDGYRTINTKISREKQRHFPSKGKSLKTNQMTIKSRKRSRFLYFFSSLDFNDSLDQIQGPIVTRFMTKLEKKTQKILKFMDILFQNLRLEKFHRLLPMVRISIRIKKVPTNHQRRAKMVKIYVPPRFPFVFILIPLDVNHLCSEIVKKCEPNEGRVDSKEKRTENESKKKTEQSVIFFSFRFLYLEK